MIAALENIYKSTVLDKSVKRLALEAHLVQKNFKLENETLATALRFIARRIELGK